MRLPERVTICEVGPRDGLQNETRNVPTPDKIRLIEALADAGISRDEAVIFLSASETHSRKNINKSIAEALETYREVAAAVEQAGLRLKGAISTSFGCPYEGDVDPLGVVGIAMALVEMGVDEVGVADTTGMANPRQVFDLVSHLARQVPIEMISLHFHDTGGTALANVLAGLQAGVTIFDGAVGGLGGCPYAKGATGNVATEDLVHMLDEMGIETGVSLEKLIECARLAQSLIGRPLDSHVARSGPVRHGEAGGA